jgi:hypothetical protein
MKPIPSKKSRRAEPLSTVNPHAAGIDVGAQFHVVAVPPQCDAEAVRTFRSFTGDLHRLADWLVASMYIDIVPNRNSRPAILLRESVREGKRIIKRTLANLSALSLPQAEAIRAVLKGEALAPSDGPFEIIRSRPHGAVKAITTAMSRLRLSTLLDRKPSRERDLVLAMIAARVLEPQSKLATARSWGHSTLGASFGVAGADENALYAALDWLIERQDGIEQRLAKRHLDDGARVLYDLSSSYFEGECCPLAQRGYSRDGKKGTLQVNYGLLTDARGCPVSISVFAGNTSDPQTLLPQIEKLQKDFALESVILVGDRGMISQKQIATLAYSGESGHPVRRKVATGSDSIRPVSPKESGR